MAKNLIDIGINLNDGTGDNLRTAGTKINAMFQEVYNVFGDGTNLSNLVSNLHIVNDIAPQLGGNLDMNGYIINGNGAINILSTITTSDNLVAVGAVQASSAAITNNSTFGGTVTVGGTVYVGNHATIKTTITDTSLTTGTLNANTELQVVGPATISGAITSGAVGSKMRFYWNNVAAFPSATTYEGGIAFAEDTNRMYFASDTEWYKLAPEEAPQLTNRVVDSVIISTPTAPTASKNSTLGGQNTTQIATLAYVKDVAADYAPLASPSLTGTPTTTTQATGTRAATGASTQIANSTYVRNVAGEIYTEVDLKAPLASPSLTGTPLTPTQATGTRAATGASTQIANSTYVRNVAVEIYDAVDLKAPLASPTLTGTPLTPTAAAEINNTQIASTEYVTRGIGSAVTTINTALALKAPLASPGLTGTPTAPTAAVGTNTTQLATTAFTKEAIDAYNTAIDLSKYAKLEAPQFTNKEVTSGVGALQFNNKTQIVYLRFITGLGTADAGEAALLAIMLDTNPSTGQAYGNITAHAETRTPPTPSTYINLSDGIETAKLAIGLSSPTTRSNQLLAAIFASPSFAAIRDNGWVTYGSIVDVPRSTTAAVGTNSTQIATTAFVKTAIDTKVTDINLSQYAKVNSQVFTGTPTVPTPSDNNDTLQIANTAFVQNWTATYGNVPKWGGARKYVNTSAPIANNGENGDIWIQPGLDDTTTVLYSVPWNSVTSKPSFFDGAYSSLSGKPSLFDGNYNNLSNKPVSFDVASTPVFDGVIDWGYLSDIVARRFEFRIKFENGIDAKELVSPEQFISKITLNDYYAIYGYNTGSTWTVTNKTVTIFTDGYANFAFTLNGSGLPRPNKINLTIFKVGGNAISGLVLLSNNVA
jgi:hypothetical protein